MESRRIDLPAEVAIPIIQIAARTSKETRYNLSRTCRAFNEWTRLIALDRLDGLTRESIPKLQNQIFNKPRHFFTSTVHTKSISFHEGVPMPIAKPILRSSCSQRILFFGGFSNTPVNPAQYLPFVRSPYLRRLCLLWDPPDNVYENRSPFLNLTRPILSNLTHLCVYHLSTSSFLPSSWLWETLSDAMVQIAADRESAHLGAFRNLTHVALTIGQFSCLQKLFVVAPNLNYAVVIHNGGGSDNHLCRTLYVMQKTGNHRLVVVSAANITSKDLVDSSRQNQFWQWAENLVDDGFLTDSGVRWDDRSRNL